MAARIVWVRMRFLAVLVVAFVVVGRWDVLRNYWSTFTRSIGGVENSSQTVSNDTEYFCPMDPGV
ncbi:MAG TPA: hypothetical protein VGZ22_23730, partial [Isosphaeraceae bacterium]|nr:hypothetical protein [Isosphaeraceae bacterium]